MKIALCSSEVVPFAKTGGLADVCGVLPIALENIGEEVCIFLPYYKSIAKGNFGVQKVFDGLYSAAIGKNIKVYFIENENYFGRDGLYGDGKKDYPDNLQRFQFFSSKILEFLKKLNFKADIVHCHDWQTSLIPVYLKTTYKNDRFFAKTKSVLTIHNLAYQGVFPKSLYSHLQLEKSLFTPEGIEFYDQINLLKAGIVFSDRVTTVSPQYAKEILIKQFGCGLDGVLLSRKDRVIGIINGIDYEYWNPETDKYLKATYSEKNFEKKYVNKSELQKAFHLPQKKDVPIFGYVGRLAQQKGLDIVAAAINDIIKLDLQLIVFGIGEERYHTLLKDWSKQYPDKVACQIAFDEGVAHNVYAGSDLFLMPSWFEPCGLSQMISLRCGTIPLAHKIGGLADTIEPGYGFLFEESSPKALITALKKALDVYHKKSDFQKMIKTGMALRFSWDKSAQKYKETFQQCLVSA